MSKLMANPVVSKLYEVIFKIELTSKILILSRANASFVSKVDNQELFYLI